MPIAWNSTLVVDRDDPEPFAVCRRGNLEDCQEGLSRYSKVGAEDNERRRCSVLTGKFKFVELPYFRARLTLIPENCTCYGYSFTHAQKRRDNLVYFRASEYPECAVVRLTGSLDKTETLVFRFSLNEKPERYLTSGGKLALQAYYEGLPVHQAISEDKFVSHHALEYCNSQTNISISVPTCHSTFQINVERASENQALNDIEQFSVGTLPIIVFIFISLVTPFAANQFR